MSKNKSERIDQRFQDSEAFEKTATRNRDRRRPLYAVAATALIVFIGLGVFAENKWWPSTDPLTGKKTGWFGKELPKNAGSTWNPLAAPLPTATPQLKTEYL